RAVRGIARRQGRQPDRVRLGHGGRPPQVRLTARPMELADAVRRRRMVRAFDTRPVPPELVDRLLDQARRSPSAGNTQPWAFVVLEGAQTAAVWDITLPSDRRAAFRWPGLLSAPVLVVPLV